MMTMLLLLSAAYLPGLAMSAATKPHIVLIVRHLPARACARSLSACPLFPHSVPQTHMIMCTHRR
jgi:hypothetical protein